ncbi:HNH endonuclease [Gordonia phage Twister6]|uniref:HNH endonuclease n=1 Tax=Gordonia phage Twister6 TaxID=1887655 RepID=A0A1B3B1S3_9CAUD|nr:HNH endonuclease [Gordonia phage Twister6]AOE44967.1 HNH endonuclease [Gordonia phage Twister6]
MSSEEWRPVVGWEGFYEVSDHGQVRSIDRTVVVRCTDKADHTRTYRGQVLVGGRLPSGHRYVNLRRPGAPRARSTLVHQMVAEAFIGPRPAGSEVRHFDGNPDHNHASNLRWGTRSEQRRDDVRNGVHLHARKTHCPRNHPYDEENTYRPPTGGRECRACRTESRRRHEERKTA